MVSGTFQIHNLENKGHQKLCMKVLVHHCKCMYLNYYCHTSKTTADCTIDAFDTIDLNVNITISIFISLYPFCVCLASVGHTSMFYHDSSSRSHFSTLPLLNYSWHSNTNNGLELENLHCIVFDVPILCWYITFYINMKRVCAQNAT